jgi:hypothetical protein
MKLRETWWFNGEHAECIWCNRTASVCVIVDPCGDREQYEENLT